MKFTTARCMWLLGKGCTIGKRLARLLLGG